MSAQINKYEKIWLALIPVIGGIIIAFMTYVYPKYIEKTNQKDVEKTENANKNLLKKAGEINQIAVYNNYNDLYPMLSEVMQINLTREVFNAANDSMKIHLGNYIKPIDTTQNILNGNHFYYVKNQYQNGQGITMLQFDNNDKIIYLFYNKIPK